MATEQKQGKVIVFEGVNGAGKSTQIERLKRNMSAAGFRHYVTREPSDGPIGKAIREDYLLRNDNRPDQHLMSMLLATDRYDHVTSGKPHDSFTDYINRGVNIIFDRYFISSMALNSDGTEVDMERILDLNMPSIKTVTPDLTIYLDVSPGVALERVNIAGNPRDIYESGEVIRKTCELYRQAISIVSNRRVPIQGDIVIVPADGSTDLVEHIIWEIVLKLMKTD